MSPFPSWTKTIPASYLLPLQWPEPQNDEILIVMEEDEFEEKWRRGFDRRLVSSKSKPGLSNGDGYGDENVKMSVNPVVVNPLRVDAKPFFSSKSIISNNEKLKRTRSSSQSMGILSGGDGHEGETNTRTRRRLSMEKKAVKAIRREERDLPI